MTNTLDFIFYMCPVPFSKWIIQSKELGREAHLSEVHRRFKIMDNGVHLDHDGPEIIVGN